MINVDRKFILLLPQKTGSTSITHLMKEQGVKDEMGSKHHTLGECIKNWKDEWGDIDEYLIASTLRNCYDKVASTWESKKGKIIAKSFTNYCLKTHKPSLASKIVFFGQYSPQAYINFETLQDDFRAFCNMVDIKKSDIPKKNMAKNREHYSKYYSNESKKCVEKMYKDDILIFNFKFENQ